MEAEGEAESFSGYSSSIRRLGRSCRQRYDVVASPAAESSRICVKG
jgi:hypothetical protein